MAVHLDPLKRVINIKWGNLFGLLAGGGHLAETNAFVGRRFDASGGALASYPVTAYQTHVGNPGSREELPTPRPFLLQSIAGLPSGAAVAGYSHSVTNDIVVGDGINVDADMLIAYDANGDVIWSDIPWSTLDSVGASAGSRGGGVRVAADTDGNVYALVAGIGSNPGARFLRKYSVLGVAQWTVEDVDGLVWASTVGVVVVLSSEVLTGYNATTGAIEWTRSVSATSARAISKRPSDAFAICRDWQFVEYVSALTGDAAWDVEPDPTAFVADLDIADDGSLFVSADVFGATVETSVYRYSASGQLISTFSNIASDPGGLAGSFFGNELNGALIAPFSLFVIGHATSEEKSGGVIVHEWVEYSFRLLAFDQASGNLVWSFNWGLWTEGAAEGEMTGPGAEIIRAPQYELIRALGR